MSRNRLIPVVTLLVGIVVGWAVHGRNQAQHPNPLAFNFKPGREFRIVRPALSGNDWRLMPFAVNHGENKVKFEEPPADAAQIWLITYDGVIVSCRSEQAPSQQP